MSDVFINNLILSGVFVRGVVLIVLIGLMVAELIKRDKKTKKAILYFIVAFVTYFGILMMDLFSPVFIPDGILKALIYLVLDFVSAGSFIGGLYQYWYIVNTKDFVLVVFFTVCVVIFEVIFSFQVNLYLAILYLIVISLSILFMYFLVINFLINISKDSIIKKLSKPSKKTVAKRLMLYLLVFIFIVMFLGVLVRLIIRY